MFDRIEYMTYNEVGHIILVLFELSSYGWILEQHPLTTPQCDALKAQLPHVDHLLSLSSG